jgi:hypothetical protein
MASSQTYIKSLWIYQLTAVLVKQWTLTAFTKAVITDEIQKIYSKLVLLEAEVSDLRQGYLIINRRYTNALASLK